MRTRHCTAACSARPTCVVCERTKWPLGHVTLDDAYCTPACAGYSAKPKPGHLLGTEPAVKSRALRDLRYTLRRSA